MEIATFPKIHFLLFKNKLSELVFLNIFSIFVMDGGSHYFPFFLSYYTF